MGEGKTIIEINGKRYDALSGNVVKQHPEPRQQAKKKSNGRNMDGFFVKPKAAKSHRTKNSSTVQRSKPSSEPVHGTKTQPARTLMRKAVKRPTTPKAPIHARSHPKTASGHTPKYSKIKKSPLISRFGNTPAPVHKRVAPLPVKPAPEHGHTHNNHPDMAQEDFSQSNKLVHVPKQQLAQQPKSPLNVALQKATSHDQPKTAKKKLRHRAAHKLGVSPKIVSISASVLAFVLLASFFAYQNAPNFAMHIASSRAGFRASLPDYQPSGYALGGPIDAKPGIITVSFESNSDERSFKVTQRPSSWTSEALFDNFLQDNNGTGHQTFQEKDRTVYIYDGSNATWVSDGIWYQVEGNGHLNNEQLLRIANSL